MSLNKDKSNAAAAEAAQPSARDESFMDAGSSSFTGHSDLFSLNSAVPAGMSRFETGEQLIEAMAAIQGILDKNNLPASSVKLVAVDGEANHLPISGILVACPRRIEQKVVTASFLLLLEASADDMSTRTFNLARGNMATIPAVAGDYLDENLLGVVEQIAQKTLVSQGGQHVYIGGAVIPKEVELKAESAALRSVLFNAVTAAESSLRIMSNAPVVTGEDIAADNNNLTARLNMDHSGGANQVGLPNRTDITIDLRAVKRGGRNNGGFGEQAAPQTQSVARIAGFMDILYNEEAQTASGGWGKKSEPNLQRYLPRYILTDVRSSFNFESLELQLLAIAQAGLLVRNNAWANAFRPKNIKGTDIHNIGAVGLDLELMDKRTVISTDPKNFSDRDFHELIETIFPADRLIIAMDLEETGVLSWLHGIILNAAEGSEDAHKALINAANTITSGHFDRFFDGGPIGFLESSRIPLGHYEDENGNLRDIRDGDYLAVLNLLGQGDEDAIAEWCSTQFGDAPDVVRLEQHLKMLNVMFGGSVTVTGYARRYNFNANFINALVAGIEQAGIYVTPDNVHQEMGSRTVRGMKGLDSLAVGAQAGQMFRSAATGRSGNRSSWSGGFGAAGMYRR